ncbi:MAG TPA: bifunctional phosphopantothenoylcysteine decarboxylase/phosphopantothenate--cysteine ligase CoaBC [bacterium]|nr:bifunctional phosphopantothenoylcysteine decarboxylase/phosphopantothenate--cysteine ligase CoaBC [bacterium]
MKFENLRVLVTAGPTREFFDPVRFLSNPSSGKMGYALAEEARLRGATVTLVTGPVSIAPPPVKVVAVTSAEEMYRAVLKEARRAALILMCAAVSDYRPASFSKKKLKKTGKPLSLTLVRTKDILAELGRRKKPGQILVGFAAETHRVEAYARNKLREKNLDAIVANRVGRPGAGFEGERNEALLLSAAGGALHLKSMSKKAMARKILGFLAYSFGDKKSPSGED